ncbi:MAG TPA: hypothetical protein VGE00_08135 [Gammaproteobacteria bacterium]
MRAMGWMLLLSALPLRAEETLLLRESSIKAMEGLPTVTFVVPWQASRPDDFVTLPTDSVLDEHLLPLDGSLLPPRQTNMEHLTTN